MRLCKKTALTTPLLDCMKNTALTTTLVDYVKNTAITTPLLDNVKNTALTTTLLDYLKNTALTNTLLSYPTIDYIKQTYVNIEYFNLDVLALNHNDIILSNGINTLNSRITDNYNLLYDSFSPAEKIAYSIAGTQCINVIASLIEVHMIMNLRTRMYNVETWDNEIEALYNWIDNSNLNRLGSATTTPISKLSDLYVLRSNIIL